MTVDCYIDSNERQHAAGMAVHGFVMAAEDVRQLTDAEIAESADDLTLALAVLAARLRRASGPTDTG